MSFQPITGTARFGVKVTGLNELQAAIEAMKREVPMVKTKIHTDAAAFFVYKAKSRVHVISGNLGRSIKVDSATARAGIVSANMPYAAAEEGREGKRRLPPHTPHMYMHPAAIETGAILPTYIKKRFDEMFQRHRTRAAPV
jgi:hypothetical protein